MPRARLHKLSCMACHILSSMSQLELALSHELASQPAGARGGSAARHMQAVQAAKRGSGGEGPQARWNSWAPHLPAGVLHHMHQTLPQVPSRECSASHAHPVVGTWLLDCACACHTAEGHASAKWSLQNGPLRVAAGQSYPRSCLLGCQLLRNSCAGQGSKVTQESGL